LQILPLAISLDRGDQRMANVDIAQRSEASIPGTTNTSILLVCRKIYYDARVLPFQKAEFAFPRCNGLSTAECLQFFSEVAAMANRRLKEF
jgi:hypothetical protein